MSYYRKIIRICAEDSPNVKRALYQRSQGVLPDGKTILAGVLPWDEYQNRRRFWDPVRQCIGLDARFYSGAQLLLFPPEWLDLAEQRSRSLAGTRRVARALGIDPAEGGDRTTMAAVDELGLIEMLSMSTPNTALITTYAVDMARKHSIPWDRVCFDRGGGGQQHADRMRATGCKGVRTVAFGETLTLDPKRGLTQVETRMSIKEERYEYKNRRAQMYGELSEMLNPSLRPQGFALFSAPTDPLNPSRKNLRGQLSVMPKLYDGEDRLVMLPKNLPTQDRDIFEQAGTDTLVGLIGHSPDEADALVLAVHAMIHEKRMSRAGVAF